MENMIETFDGHQELRENCRKIRDKYYVKGKDCHQINGRWYLVSEDNIVFDHELQKWVLKSGSLILGIVGFKDGVPIKDYFSSNIFNNVAVSILETTITSAISYFDDSVSREVKTTKFTTYIAINNKILIENNFVENLSTGEWILPTDCKNISSLAQITNVFDPTRQQYNIEDNKDEYKDKVKQYNKYNTPISRNAKLYAKFLGDVTFGVELETICGYLPVHIQYRYGIIVCRDGSLKAEEGQGSEYTTIPLSGAKGLTSLHYGCKEIAKRNKINLLCALHVHIGNIKITRCYIVALYMLCRSIQEELFNMFAYYKRDEKKYAYKEKNYCNKLLKLGINPCNASSKEEFTDWINWCYRKIFAFLSENGAPDRVYNRKNKQHPKNQKWERKNRYFWMNLMNVFFSNRNTIEFRLHTGTMNSQKAINWLFICNAIVKTAASRAGEILKGKQFTLKEVISYYSDTFQTERSKFLVEYLNSYIQLRKNWMKRDLDKEDYTSEWEMKEDRDFEFQYESVIDLV
jgi:hypothetical protein